MTPRPAKCDSRACTRYEYKERSCFLLIFLLSRKLSLRFGFRSRCDEAPSPLPSPPGPRFGLSFVLVLACRSWLWLVVWGVLLLGPFYLAAALRAAAAEGAVVSCLLSIDLIHCGLR